VIAVKDDDAKFVVDEEPSRAERAAGERLLALLTRE
jgi:hypothetical protein